MDGKKIGFIGAGNMAGALIKGLLCSKTVAAAEIMASDVRGDRLADLAREHGISTQTDNEALLAWADIVVLAVKPQVVDQVLSACGRTLRPVTLLVSIAAGVPIQAIESRLPEGSRVVRTMPNTAAMALAGATAIAPGTHASQADVATAREIFRAVGTAVVVDESLMDAVTGLSGSGPAYVMLVIEALADGGVKVGLPRETALQLAAQTVYGSAKLLLDTAEHPARLKDMVTSPGGTTIAGLHALEHGALRATLINAVEAATRRSAELGAKMAETRRKSSAS
jgi:pyrroline-5-carboxylate reductase